MSEYRVYRSAEGVLIRTASGEIELSTGGAVALGRELSRSRTYKRWSAKDKEELRRLYQDEGLGTTEIARRYGQNPDAINATLRRMGIPARDQARSAVMAVRTRAKHLRRVAP